MERERSKSPYKEFQPGDKLDFNLQTLLPDGSVQVTPKTIVIEALKGGGFFGKVLLPKDEPFVIKTSLPDPWHHLWRAVNWNGKEFPAQVNETDAQLEHLATRIIHRVLPVMSNGKFYAPDSLGYTRLSTGYAQVVEKIDGRPPRFDGDGTEYEKFRNAQRELSELVFRLGLEQVGQIHPDNPFGMANIWFDEKNKRFVWLDTTPAIPHKDFIKPLFWFKFGKDIREKIGTKDITFNRIHTDQLAAELLSNNDLFPSLVLDEIRRDIRLYANLRRIMVETKENPQQTWDALDELGKDLRIILLHFLPDRVRDIKKLMDPVFAKDLLLSGVKEAEKQKVITKEEFERAKMEIEKVGDRKFVVLPRLFLWYLASGQLINLIEISLYGSAVLTEDKALMALLGLFVGRGVPLVLNPSSTLIAGLITGTDLKEAAKFSAIPWAGPLLAIPAQVRKDRNRSDIVWNSTKRYLVANLSKLNPAGGWGTQAEAELWRDLHTIVENLDKFLVDEESKTL